MRDCLSSYIPPPNNSHPEPMNQHMDEKRKITEMILSVPHIPHLTNGSHSSRSHQISLMLFDFLFHAEPALFDHDLSLHFLTPLIDSP